MKVERLETMKGGWFVGDFEPTVLRSEAVEVSVKHYTAGQREAWHVHRVAAEITAIVTGEVVMNGRRCTAGDIVLLEPGEGTDFHAITDAITTVVKMPSVRGDKYDAEGRRV